MIEIETVHEQMHFMSTYKGVTFMVSASSATMLLRLFPLRLFPLRRRMDCLRNEPTLEIELRAIEFLPLLLIDPPLRDSSLS